MARFAFGASPILTHVVMEEFAAGCCRSLLLVAVGKSLSGRAYDLVKTEKA